ncbi:MAG: hypothetical protein PF444_01630 [Bacteroidales bacterium]|jgi:transcription elongation GreA/GreB family factor|nr:hypothetical protein [Bacteroidales bacterium]
MRGLRKYIPNTVLVNCQMRLMKNLKLKTGFITPKIVTVILFTHYSLLTTHYSLSTTHYSLLTTHYSLLTTHYPLLTTHYPLLTTHLFKMHKVIKLHLISDMLQRIEEKVSTIQNAIALAKESRDSDGKSSVGDKFETGRAMMQIEIQNKENQLGQTLGLKKVLSTINPKLSSDSVTLGSYVKTDKGNYFLSIPLGIMKSEFYDCMAISLASPLGRIFNASKVGDKVSFNGRGYEILEVF